MAINIPMTAAMRTLSLAVVRMVKFMISSLERMTSLAGDGLEWRDAACGGWHLGAS